MSYKMWPMQFGKTYAMGNPQLIPNKESKPMEPDEYEVKKALPYYRYEWGTEGNIYTVDNHKGESILYFDSHLIAVEVAYEISRAYLEGRTSMASRMKLLHESKERIQGELEACNMAIQDALNEGI